MKIQISFEAPERIHSAPYSHTPKRNQKRKAPRNITISDLAFILESKYHLLEKFSVYFQQEIEDELVRVLVSEGRSDEGGLVAIGEFVKEKWRDYIVSELHRIKTKAAELEGRESFIVTQGYYLNILPSIRLINN